MTKILHAISTAAMILAGVVIASVIVPGFRDRSDIRERFPAASDTLETFRQQSSGKDRDSLPPLIEQARLFAKIINPPGPRQQKPDDNDHTWIEPPLPRFSLAGTSYSCNLDESFALVGLANQPPQWVRPGEKIGHAIVEEVQDGSIRCRDERRGVEIPVPPIQPTGNPLEAGTSP